MYCIVGSLCVYIRSPTTMRSVIIYYLLGMGKVDELHVNARILRVGGNLSDLSQLLEESQKTFDVASDLLESTRVIEVLGPVCDLRALQCTCTSGHVGRIS